MGHLIRFICVMILFLSQVDLLCADAVTADMREAEVHSTIPFDDEDEENSLYLDQSEQFCRTSLRVIGLEPQIFSLFSLIMSPEVGFSGNSLCLNFDEEPFWRQPNQAVYCIFLI